MARAPKNAQGTEDVPHDFPEVAPPAYAQAVGAGYLVETVMQIQQSIGELKATVSHLKESSDKQSAKLDSISHKIYAAGVVIALVLAGVGFLLNKMWDGIFILLKASH